MPRPASFSSPILMIRLASLIALALLLAGPAVAQDFPSTPPEPGEPQPFEIPEGETFTLDNGIDVTLVPYGALPKANVLAVVRVGNVDETAGENSLADLLMDLLQEGTTSMSAEEIAEAAASMGGSISSSAGLDQASVGGRVLAEFVPDFVRLTADVLQNPAFPADGLERARRNRLRGAAIARSQPGTLALAAFRRAVYGPDHPYTSVILPVAADIEAATVEDVQDFYRANVGPARTRIYVVGQFDEAATEAAIRDAFGSWDAPAMAADPTPPTASVGRQVVLVDQPGAAQSNVIVGIPTIDPAAEAQEVVELQVTNALLGGSFGSRITRNIREDKGYTYSPGSSVSSRFRDAYWAETAAIVTESTGPAITEIFNEIDRLATEAPTEEELEGIQNYLAGNFVLQNSSAGGIAGFLAFLDLHGIDRDYLENYVERVYDVTPEDVRETTAERLSAGDMTIVVVGDRGVVEGQLGEFGEVDVQTLD